MRVCPFCKGMLVKHGFLKKEHTQRYRCLTCKKTSSEANRRQFGTLRTSHDKIRLTIKMLCEGGGIRATARVAGIHRDTVLSILRFAGGRAQILLEKKLKDVTATSVQVDEIWTTVRRRHKAKIDPEIDRSDEGDFYVYLGMEADTKLLFSPLIGKRTELTTGLFADSLAASIAGRVQITTDGFRPYKDTIRKAFGERADFAQYYKENNTLAGENRTKALYLVRSGFPKLEKISTCHIERCNLTLRTMNKRFNRETACISKTLEYLNYSVDLFAAYYNFCKLHSALGKKTTPAMANGLAEEPWDVDRLVQWV